MITMYTRTQCQFCDSAKRFLQSRNINYREVNIDVDPQAYEFMQNQGHRSVPQFYVGPRLLVPGGWAALQKLSTTEILDLVGRGPDPVNSHNLGTL
jgi:glutaredoxin